MKKTTSKKLSLSKESIRQLDRAELKEVGGALGGRTIRSFCNYCFSMEGEGCTAPTATC